MSYREVGSIKIAVDAEVEVYINGEKSAVFISAPVDLEALAYGYLYSEGYIDDISQARLKIEGTRIWAEVPRGRRTMVVSYTEDCGVAPLIKFRRGGEVPLEVAVELAREFTKYTIWHVEPELAMHTSALYVDGVWLVVHDTSRHSGVVKLVGRYLMEGLKGQKKIGFTTGRVSADIVNRLASIGVSAIVSLRGPLYSGVEAACKLGIPLIANVKTRGFTLLCPSNI